MITSLIQRYKAWRKRKYWKARHMEFLQNMISEDWRWLAANPVCDALTTRYKRAASASWYELEHESSSVFRQRLGEIARGNDEVTSQIKKAPGIHPASKGGGKMSDFDTGILEQQMQLSAVAIKEVNRLRGEVSRLTKELAAQTPTIWAQQERIVVLESALAAAIGQQEGE